MEIIDIVLLLMSGVIGYGVFYVLGIPIAPLLGPFFAVIGFNIVGLKIAPLTPEINYGIQILLGVLIGCDINRRTLRKMKSLFIPSIMMVVWTLTLTLGLGYILIQQFGLDPSTAFLSTAPSGLAETGMIAVVVGANVGLVSAFQLTRFLMTLLVFPMLLNWFNNQGELEKAKPSYFDSIKIRLNYFYALTAKVSQTRPTILKTIPYLITICLGAVGGYIGIKLSIPAGAMIGAFLIIGIVSLLGVPIQKPPIYIRMITQIGIGLSLGLNISDSSYQGISSLIIPLLSFTFFMFFTAFVMYRLLRRTTNWSQISCILAVAPAGLTPMTMLAYEHSENPLEVSLLHMVRLLTVKAFILPLLVMYLMSS